MPVMDLTDTQLREYYQDTLSGDGVCTLTEDEFVDEYRYFQKEGQQIALSEFTGMPATVDLDRSFMIDDAQKLGQKTYQTVIVVDGKS